MKKLILLLAFALSTVPSRAEKVTIKHSILHVPDALAVNQTHELETFARKPVVAIRFDRQLVHLAILGYMARLHRFEGTGPNALLKAKYGVADAH